MECGVRNIFVKHYLSVSDLLLHSFSSFSAFSDIHLSALSTPENIHNACTTTPEELLLHQVYRDFGLMEGSFIFIYLVFSCSLPC